MVPTTPNSELRRRLESDVKRSEANIRIVEKSSTNVKGLLQKSNPFRVSQCNKEDCLVCESKGKGNCRTAGITYELECEACGDKYIGETGRNAYTRGKEHLMALDSSGESSVLRRHCTEKHDGYVMDFRMNVLGTFQGDAMLRQIAESVRICRENQRRLINNKSEWNFLKIPRANIV